MLGLVGLFLPFLQGVLLLLAGLSVLSSEYVWPRKILHRLGALFPGFAKGVHDAETWVRARLKWIFPSKSKDPGE